MTKKKTVIFAIVAAVALVLAGALGLGLYFLLGQNVKGAPQSIQVQMIDGEQTLVAEYGGGYGYDFLLEQRVNGKFVAVCVASAPNNSIKLSSTALDVHLGGEYRFSARWTNKNKVGQFGEAIVWQPEVALAQVDAQTVQYNQQTHILSWQAVDLAQFYNVLAVSANGQQQTIKAEDCSCNLSQLGGGAFNIFLQACSSNNKVLPSIVEVGRKEIVVENEIIRANLLSNGSILVVCSQKAQQFEIFADGQSCGKVSGNASKTSDQNWQILLSDARLALAGVNVLRAKIEICSCEQPFMPQSEKVEVV